MGSYKCRCYDCVRSKDRIQEVRHGGVTEEELPHRSRKDKKRWCKGKVGREHYIVRTTFHEHWTTYACTKCGKLFWELGYSWNK